MYCIKCGVKLADTEAKCPLCGTVVYHPDYPCAQADPLYPKNKMPKTIQKNKLFSGAVIILFMIPLLVCYLADLMRGGSLEWFGYVAGGLVVAYISFALPFWFRKPNPVIFVPCDFLTVALYLLYIEKATGGKWYFEFALPVVGALAIIVCAVVTLLRYLRKGRLYVIGGAFIALGAFLMEIELLMDSTFNLQYLGWSVYPLTVLVLFGLLLIYFAIDPVARETMERKLFF